MCAEEEESSGNTSSDDGNKLANKLVFKPINYGTTSAAAARPTCCQQHESIWWFESTRVPPLSTGVFHKKDSGYTSSRTSLEPSECGDEPQQQAPSATTPSNLCSSSSSSTTLVDAAVTTTIHIDESTDSELLLNSSGAGHRNSLQDTTSPSVATTIISNGAIHERKNSAIGRPLFFENPMRTPAVDYEEYFPDQTVHSSCPNKTETSTTKFVHKKLAEWDCIDVCDWLADLNLQQYSDSFAEQNISGADLVSFDRARFTHLGVTMIRHRQTMENSLRSYI
uniref:SAM domain-containing protein n=1 Tax=Ditylenchus dipsaci TaxID=166011 RepID=A0A915EVS4_9BILA